MQELATQAIGDGHHAIVLAPTAGGKTEAAMFPVLSGLLADPKPGVGALYIAPIRALLNNQEERLSQYAEMVGLQCFKWHGETVASARKGFLKEPGELLMTTPESLEVLLVSGHTPEQLFRHLRYVVIDEIHALAACDRGQHLLCLLERLRLRADHDIQRIGLSATVGNPDALVDWLRGSSPRTGVLVQPPAVVIPRQLGIRHGDDLSLANQVAARAKGRKSLCFTDSRARAEKIARTLQAQDLPVFVHHSSVAAPERAAAEAAMHHGQEQCIVCTSTLELGIDVGELDAVFQVDAPATVASFLQRLGRTGRRPGTVANTTFLTTSPEALLQATAILELARQHRVESLDLPRRSWHLLVHQTLALCLERGQISADGLWRAVGEAACFAGITRSEADRLWDYLQRMGYLEAYRGQMRMGPRAEAAFGRQHFMELYSVFTSPRLWQVQNAHGHSLGTVEGSFAEHVERGQDFLLGGRGWIVEAIDEAKCQLTVSPAPAGRAPRWGGFAPKILTYELCQQVRQVVAGTEVYAYLDAAAQDVLAETRALHATWLPRAPLALQELPQQCRWWTYAGYRINNTLRLLLGHLLGVTLTANNYYLGFDPSELTPEGLALQWKKLLRPEFWADPQLELQLQELLPNWRLSKFQDALPPWARREVLAQHWLDLPATRAWVQCSGNPA